VTEVMDEIDRILAGLAKSPTAARHATMLRELGYTTHLIDELAIGGARLDHVERRLEVVSSLHPSSKRALAAHELRHVWHDKAGVLDLIAVMPPEDYLAAMLVMEADAHAWLVHVAAELKAAGDGAMWLHLGVRNVYGPATEAYLEALAGGRTVSEACTWAFNEIIADDEFCDVYTQIAELDVPTGMIEPEADAFERMVSLIRSNGPDGNPYHGDIFDGAVHHVRTMTDHIKIEREPGPSAAP